MNPNVFMILVVVGVVFFLPLIYMLVQYNALITLRNCIRESWSDVDTELKGRYDLIPNLVTVVKAYAAHGLRRQALGRVAVAFPKPVKRHSRSKPKFETGRRPVLSRRAIRALAGGRVFAPAVPR